MSEPGIKDATLAATPPMGWNSWNRFRCHGLDERMVVETADAMVSSGMRDAGYVYVVIDDCWQALDRGPDGALQAHPERFPHGMLWLGEQIHARGLKFGLYLSPGRKTCAMIYDQYPARELGSFGHEQQDIDTLTSWGVDYLKYDWCEANLGGTGLRYEGAFEHMASVIAQSSRPMLMSISEYGRSRPWTWAGAYGHLWRTTPDIEDSWRSVMRVVDRQHGLARYAGPGGWNDPDMLEVGNGGLTPIESRSHFMLWAMLAAPLMAGNDLRGMDSATRELLTHRGVLAISQDVLGHQGERIHRFRGVEVWRRELHDGVAIGILNRSRSAVSLSLQGEVIGLGRTELAMLPAGAIDVWTGAPAASSWTLHPHEMTLLRASETTAPA